MLVLSLPIPIIAGNFEDFHRMQQTKTKAEKAKKKLTEAKANEEAERVAFCKAEVTMKTNSDNVSTKQIDQKWQDVSLQLRRQGGEASPQQTSFGRSASISSSSSSLL